MGEYEGWDGENKEGGYSLKLVAPFTMQLISPSRGGKSTWLYTLLEHANEIIEPKPDVIYFCYSEKSPEFDRYPNVNFVYGFDPSLVSEANYFG